MKNSTLFLDFPASEWELASPIGNGSTGAMIYGGTDCERIQLSHEAIWAGGVQETTDDGYRDRMDVIRRLLLEGKGAEADEYGKNECGSYFHRIGSNETAGDLLLMLDGGESADYRRELDLIHGILRVSYQNDSGAQLREAFASYPDCVIAMRHTGAHSVRIRYARPFAELRPGIPKTAEILAGTAPDVGVKSVEICENEMTVHGTTADERHDFTVKVRILTDGALHRDGGDLVIDNANKTEYFIVIGAECEPQFPADDFDTMLARSAADVASLMERAELQFGGDAASDAMSAHKRLARLREDAHASDPNLAALYWQFGRYLLVSSSRPGTLPANLQGVWNGYIKAPWNNDYHTNINLQMNYWHAEVTNLSECAEPLFDYMNGYLLESGRKTAKDYYRCRGTVLHHLSDIYGYTAPADGLWGLWPLGGAWLCYSMWEHWLYTGDREYLRDTAYAYIRDSARFFLDYMFEDEKGRLLSGPSTSPENRYFQNGTPVFLCLSPTMDVEIIGGLLRMYIKTEEILGICPEWAEEARAALAKMPPLSIGRHGQLMEWLEDYDEPEPGHRHVSHLFALYPDAAITPETPELFAAAKCSLERRLANGGGHTGWSCAWLIALYARLLDGQGVADTIRKLFTCSTRESLLDSHPPFQIDGNFGAAAAITEALVQSHNGTLTLLPALPTEYASGSVRGLMVRGGAELAMTWERGIVTSLEIKAVRGDYETKLCMNGEMRTVSLKAGERFTF
ncbi:MAG: glycoside hydrolase family 95 protein [Ruminococcaceae bacterium]|nr:glycoside hydrolase family 95 protein [Oscillospiraceae bacterium]